MDWVKNLKTFVPQMQPEEFSELLVYNNDWKMDHLCFNKEIEELLKILTACVAYRNDIPLYGVTNAKFEKRQRCFGTAENKALHRQWRKIYPLYNRPFLGYEASSDGIKADPNTSTN